MESNDRLEQLLRQMYAEEEALHNETETQERLRADEICSEMIIDEEWKKFEAKHFTAKRFWGWMQIAAAIVGVLMLSGIAYAAVKILTSPNSPKEEELLAVSSIDKPSSPMENQPEGMTDSIAPTRIFENVPLDEMVNEIAIYYNKVADIQNAQAHELRLYYKWERKDALKEVVSDLNHFDHVNLAIEGEKLILKP